ncbi:MAG: flagellar basal body rod protein FlgB [Spartobacteria bacterium]|nr:flagellar basal body rod protein FlgB [Spartobacteria bacterium]
MYNHESDTINVLSKVMDITTVRHRVLADNMANVNTPKFRRSDVHFLDALRDAMDSDGGPDAIRDVQGTIDIDDESPASPDGNNVSIQKELAEMSQNQMLYNFAARAVNRKYAGLKKAISGQ